VWLEAGDPTHKDRWTSSAFRFRPHPGAPFQITHAFDNATVKGAGTGRHPAINKGRITVRLQGIDAPELHYRPSAALQKKKQTEQQRKVYLEWNHEYRQYLGETATQAFADLLRQAGQDPLPCSVLTAVDEPDEVFDVYGRFVGDIVASVSGQEQVLNRWLLREGWAHPAFYNSMSRTEIQTLTQDAEDARKPRRGVWDHLNRFARAQDFDWDLRYRGKGAKPDPNSDVGPVMIPKLFRCLSTWAVNRRAKMVGGTFGSYLRNKRDECHLTTEFLKQGASAAPSRTLDEFLELNGSFSLRPAQLVFREKPSELVGPGGAVNW